MEKFALLVYDFSKLKLEANNEVNIGDYVQSLAAKQFLPKVDVFIERENLQVNLPDTYKCIMNGWYMHGSKWPPSNNIQPLFVSFHINSKAEHVLLSQSSIDYLKQHEPIGCRDIRTMNLLKERNVDAYFSGCLTLTLGKSYCSNESSGEILFADPYIYETIPSKIVKKVKKTIGCEMNESTMRKKIMNQYKNILPKSFLENFSVSTQIEKIPTQYNHEEYFQKAEKLLQRYAKAKVVITSRIHCALPCLAMGTPVIYVHSQRENEEHNSRLNGILELFDNIIYINKNRVEFSKKITSPEDVINSNSYIKYKESLIERVEKFINS